MKKTILGPSHTKRPSDCRVVSLIRNHRHWVLNHDMLLSLCHMDGATPVFRLNRREK